MYNQVSFQPQNKQMNKNKSHHFTMTQLHILGNKDKKNQDFLNNIGKKTRFLIRRRSFATFLTALLLEIGLGSADWALCKDAYTDYYPQTSYADALKRAYNITTLFDYNKYKRMDASGSRDGIYTIIGLILLFAAVAMARLRANADTEIAHKTISILRAEYTTPLDFEKDWVADFLTRKDFLLDSFDIMYRIGWHRQSVHPVCKSVIENMSAQHPELFERLLAGKTLFPPRDYALAVIKGYLKSHPHDFQRVLDVYNPENLPKSLIQKYTDHIR